MGDHSAASAADQGCYGRSGIAHAGNGSEANTSSVIETGTANPHESEPTAQGSGTQKLHSTAHERPSVDRALTSSEIVAADTAWMRSALSLARRGLGSVAPNPSVGCILVNDGVVVGRGWTQPGGRPHAETEALGKAGPSARGATAYVTLEPCCHHGATPPCTQALIAAGVKRVVVAIEDPDERVKGKGLKELEAAGLQVTIGVLEAEARAMNEGFFMARTKQRPTVSWKVAASLDGRIATGAGQSKWITNPISRSFGHRLRASHDAIIVGIGTALADDPSLTCRLPGLEDHSPFRVVFDRKVRLPVNSKLAQTANETPVVVFVDAQVLQSNDGAERASALRSAGVDVVGLDCSAKEVPVLEALQSLGTRGITRVLLEGGPRLAKSFLEAKLVDKVYWFSAPKLLGDDGTGALGALCLTHVAEAYGLSPVAARRLGEDLLTEYSPT